MGIKHLNRFFKEESASALKFISLSELSGKKIAIDISIYMYKYASEDCLIENIYLLLSILRHYNIIPIFIFDGKPPPEKKELLQKRKEDKKGSEEEYNRLKETLTINENMDQLEKQEIQNSMDLLKRKFVNIGKKNIELVKSLIRCYGATYYDAPGEADELCALLAIKGKVWATLSEDMDMFVYGCPRVIRYISLLNHTAVLYNLKGILDSLGITQKELRQICILSGTDYNMLNHDKTTPNLYSTLKLFKKYFKNRLKMQTEIHQQTTLENQNNNLDFYHWLLEKTNYIKDYELLTKIYDIFDLTNNHDNIKVFESIKITNGPILKNEMREILKIDGFLFH